ncbi:MAG TPA: hypothetical protein VG847_10760 [Chitinophagaceae bacterium]|nr:hypothetical protein [Chitinophagaceae bacterium]
MNKIVTLIARNLMKLTGTSQFPSYFPQADLSFKHKFIQPAFVRVKSNNANQVVKRGV